MPTDKPQKLIVFSQAAFDKLQADATARDITIQALVREIVDAHYQIESPALTWGQKGKAWGAAKPKEPVKKTRKRKS